MDLKKRVYYTYTNSKVEWDGRGGYIKQMLSIYKKRGKGTPGGMQMERNLGEVGAAGIKPF